MEHAIPAGLRDFAEDVFTDEIMRARLSTEVYGALRRTIDEGRELTYEVADFVAQAMKSWALEKGATHYTHWFQPMTGSTAEKHDSFFEPGPGAAGQPIVAFSGRALIRGEADGSSFPSGGLRATFEARGYTTWDCTSPAFVKRNGDGGHTLCIPTAFCSFSGEALDEKTPLLRSMEAISRQAVRVLRCLGVEDVKRVIPAVGGEQEYFLVDKRQFQRRKDLVYTGRTLFGAHPAKGQELSDQYYAATPERVAGFMRELNEALWRLGVPAKTQHNEAAPSQYELAPLYASANVATDHNQLIMEQMRRIAEHHGFTCLLHEKPFDGINGSGKHNNWSLITDGGRNLLKPGKSSKENRIFHTFFIAVIAAVDAYAPMLRMACATLGNEHRLGGNEAPPPIISVFTGNALYRELMELCEGASCGPHVKERMRMGVSTLPVLHRDDSDRNRTSPFAFTGNKFEFRMVGSSQSLGLPNTVLNTIVAESLREIADALEAAEDPKAAWQDVMAGLIHTHARVIFNGNNYAEEWIEEAKRRNLPIIDDTVDAIGVMGDPAVQAVFGRHQVFSPSELNARSEVSWYNFATLARIEAAAMLKMARQKILPACIRYSGVLAAACNEAGRAGAPVAAQRRLLADLCERIEALDGAIEALRATLAEVNGMALGAHERALALRERVFPRMRALRTVADGLECVVDKEYWPLPSYGEMIFHIV